MLKLVIIDDEPYALKYISTIVEWDKYGFELSALIDNGQKAIEYIKLNKPNLVITDIQMPKITGIDIAKFCSENLPDVKVVFLTSFRKFEYAQQAVRFGVSDFILKPVMPDDIIQVLKKINPKEKGVEIKKFHSSEQIIKAQMLFSNMICGAIKNVDMLRDGFENACINPDNINNPCIIFNIHVKNYDEYIQNVWKRGMEKLYYAVSSIIGNVDGEYVFLVTRYSYNNAEIIGYSLNEYNDESKETAKKAMLELSELLTSTINLPHEITSVRFLEKIRELIEDGKNIEEDEFVHQNSVVNKAYEFIKENYNKAISTRDAANYVCLSSVYFGILFKQNTGETFTETLNRYRVEKAKEYLKNEDELKTSMIYTNYGFSNQGHFYKIFKQYTGMTPLKYKKTIMEKKDETIQ